MRLIEIDEMAIEMHAHLKSDDKCYHLREYTPGAGYTKSETNNLISNLKKKPSERQTKGGYGYKNKAIKQCADEFRTSIPKEWLSGATLVPMPGSKAQGDPDYDDRIEQICQKIGHGLDVRNLIVQKESTKSAHEAGTGNRIPVEKLKELYEINESLINPKPVKIFIFDDVLTAGTHFRAISDTLTAIFPEVPISGFFVARCVWE